MKLDPGTIVERYVVEEVLGAGGTAMVYLVRHKSLGTRHALKVLTLTSAAIRERMLREGQVQASLKHPNVVSVTDVMDIDGQPGLLMEYVVGPSLERALAKYKLTMGDAEILFQGILAGVKAAHDTGLVHRDLKPANVLLQRTQAGFVPKVTDFGLAKLLETDPEVAHTRSGIAMGTPSYMAPEQVRDARSVDQRADIWSLGCLLYELTTRRRTFPGDEALAIYNSVTDGKFIPPRQVVGDVPLRVEKAIHGCLTVDRDQRIPDCATLEAVLKGEKDWALPPDVGEAREADTPTVVRSVPAAAPRRGRAMGGEEAAGPTEQVASPASTNPGGGGFGRGSSLPSTGGLLSTGGAIEEATNVPRLPPPIDPTAADEAETVLVSRSAIDGTLLPDDANVGHSLDGEAQEGTAWWVYLLLVAGALGVAMLLLFAFGAAVMSTLLNDRVLGFGEAVEEPAPVAPKPALPKAAPSKPVAPKPAVPNPHPTSQPEPTPPEPTAPTPSPTPDPKPQPAPAPAPAAPPPAPAPAPAPAGVEAGKPDVTGRIRVKFGSAPQGADLWVGGFKRSRTPASFDLDPGTYQVIMQQRGGEQREFNVTVVAGETASWCYDFGTAGVTLGSCPMIGPGSFTP